MTPLEAVKECISNLQPYMISRRKDQEPVRSFICVVDKLYRVSVYIKVDKTQFEEVIVSFHEDNRGGKAKPNIARREPKSKYVPVFADRITGKITGKNMYSVEVFVQRGLLSIPVNTTGVKCKEVFVIERLSVDREFLMFCNNYIEGVYVSDLELGQDDIDAFTILEQLSFTSYGKDTFSTLSLIVDSLLLQTNNFMKKVADTNMLTFIRHLRLTESDKERLIRLVVARYSVRADKKMDVLVDRIVDEISALSEDKEV